MAAADQVAVVGVGRWGARHLEKLVRLRGEENAAFYEEAPGRRAEVAARYPRARAFASWEDFLASDVKAAVVAAPAARHALLAREALTAGKDLLVEKPLALTAADAAAVARDAGARGAILMVGHTLLFEPAFVRLKGLITAGELGAPGFFTASRAKLGVIRTEEDVLQSFAVHDVAAALWLFGAAVASVAALGVDARGTGLLDAAFVNLAWEDGFAGHVWASWLYPRRERRFVVVGERAMATADQEGEGAAALIIHRAGVRAGSTATFNDGDDRLTFPATDALEEELKHFLGCVATREAPRADGAQGAAVVAVLAAARASARAGGAPAVPEPVIL
jgi:UDP-2-acetamido-3-amino-2,3-dideoxy-glucuronate N-acetyltransferase